jgi:hypothetical protein
MSQMGFNCNLAGVAGVGVMRVLLAWDPSGEGDTDPDAAVYTLTAPFLTPLAAGSIKSTTPIQIPQANCPISLAGLVVKFALKPGGAALSTFADFTFQVFSGSQLIYSVAPGSDVLKVQVTGLSITEITFQDSMTSTSMDDTVAIDVSGLSTVTASQVYDSLLAQNGPPL